ncbi:MAG: hypothetical protein AABZ39_01945 [Spirochaetota bacterium]
MRNSKNVMSMLVFYAAVYCVATAAVTFMLLYFADMFHIEEGQNYFANYRDAWGAGLATLFDSDNSLASSFINTTVFCLYSYAMIFIITMLVPMLVVVIRAHFVNHPVMVWLTRIVGVTVFIASFLPFVVTATLVEFLTDFYALKVIVVVFGVGITHSIIRQMEIKFGYDIDNEGYVEYLEYEGYSTLAIAYLIMRNNVSFLINILAKNLTLLISTIIFIEMILKGNSGFGPAILRNLEVLFNKPNEFFFALGNLFVICVGIMVISFILQTGSFLFCYAFDNKFRGITDSNVKRFFPWARH